MHAGRGNAKKNIAFRDIFPWKKRASLGRANTKACKIVVACGIHAGHLGCLAANQRRARLAAPLRDPFHNARRGIHVKLSAGKIVEEEKRLRTLNGNIIRAHGDKIDADRVVKAGFNGDLEFRARRHHSMRRGWDR